MADLRLVLHLPEQELLLICDAATCLNAADVLLQLTHMLPEIDFVRQLADALRGTPTA